jgi:RHS repeat-associated protein
MTPIKGQTFGYDSLNRLTSASEASAWSQAYNYDQYGNMWIPTTTGLPVPPTGPAAPTANAYTAASNRNANSTYDAAGNLTVFGAASVTYDAENRQKASGANSYLYDGLGERVEKVLSSGTTVYVYNAFSELVAEYSAAVVTAPCTTCYLSYDQLGSTRLVTDANVNVISRHDFAPFGQEIPAGLGGRTTLWGGTDNVSQKFTGQIRDSESGEDFFNARDRSSGLTRFMSADPANAGADIRNPQTLNGYSYVLGNPLANVDPSGKNAITDLFGGIWNAIAGFFDGGGA